MTEQLRIVRASDEQIVDLVFTLAGATLADYRAIVREWLAGLQATQESEK